MECAVTDKGCDVALVTTTTDWFVTGKDCDVTRTIDVISTAGCDVTTAGCDVITPNEFDSIDYKS